MLVRDEFGANVTSVKLYAVLNAASPILVTDCGMVTFLKPERLNADAPIVVTLSGMVTSVNFVVP